MADFFPRQTGAWVAQEAQSFRRLSFSVVEMAVLTGLVLRIYRALVLSRGSSGGWIYLTLTFALALILLFGMTTLHLGNFAVRQWLWRAPVFALVEATTESLASLVLVALGREPLGSTRATLHDWPALVRDIYIWRVLWIGVFALLLAGVVQLTRFVLLKREHRAHTFHAVHTHEMEIRHQK